MASWSQEWDQVRRRTRKALGVTELLLTWVVVVAAQLCVKTHNTSHLKTHPSLPKPVFAGSQPHDKPKEREERWQKGTSGKGTKKQNIQGQCLGKGFGDCYLYMELTRSRELNLLSFLKKLYSQRKKKPGLKKPWVV